MEKKTKQIRPEYEKMRNNLLGLKVRDPAVFVGKDTKGLAEIIANPEAAYSRKKFGIEIRQGGSNELTDKLGECENYQEFKDCLEQESYAISLVKSKALKTNFALNSKKIIAEIKNDKELFLARWKKYKHKYESEQIQKNSWPLYVGTMLLKCDLGGAKVYAPLVLRRAEIEINENRVFLNSYDDAPILNEKLAFLINREYGVSIPKLDFFEETSLQALCENYEKILLPVTKTNFTFNPVFQHLKKDDVSGSGLSYAPGIVLFTAFPSGGKLRDKFIELLDGDEIDNLLDTQILSGIKQAVADSVWTGTENILRITPTDLSQEVAIKAALKSSTIVWGPPGTGKSQTISNILANLLHTNKTVLVTSEKKAALDVIKERMGRLSKYLFFALVEKGTAKNEFYTGLQELYRAVEYIRESGPRDYRARPFLTKAERDFYDLDKDLGQADIPRLAEAISFMGKHDYWKHRQDDLTKLQKHKELIIEACAKRNLEEVIAQKNLPRTGMLWWKRYTNDIEELIAIQKRSGEAFYQLGEILTRFDEQTLDKCRLAEFYLNKEKDYRNLNSEFISDENFLEEYMAARFKSRLLALYNDPVKTKAVKSFWNGVQSGYLKPYNFLRKHADVIRDLFTVFVSTPNTLADFIDMDRKYSFAIFDEASQLHLEKAVPFLAICRNAVIAGDEQQMKPSSYFAVRDETELVEDSEENAVSLLEFAKRKALPVFMLNKNYRAKSSALMAFSSVNFYEGRLDTIDQHGYKNAKAIEVIDMKGSWDQQTNHAEAVAALDRTLVEVKNNQVILLALNSKQKVHLENLIFSGDEKYEPLQTAMDTGKLKLRSLENVQGDEADVVVITVAYDQNAKFGATYVGKPEGRNALNVAISRARLKIIVFKSLQADRVNLGSASSSVTTFQKWLKYLEMSTKDRNAYLLEAKKLIAGSAVTRFDSEFEKSVYDMLLPALSQSGDFKLVSQYQVGSYSVDLAVLENKKDRFVLGVEVDGYLYHGGAQKRMEDAERQRFIQDKGYKITRVTSLDWQMSTPEVVQRIVMQANSLKVKQNSQEQNSSK